MLYYDRIEVSERIDVNKTSELEECNICNYWYFLHKGLQFQSNIWNGSDNLLIMSKHY